MNSKSLFTKWVQRFFWLAIVALVVIFIGGGFFIYQYWGSRGLTVKITGPEEVNIGVPFELIVGFDNQSKNILKNARLSLTLPDGVVNLRTPEEQRISSKELGDIGLGSLSQESYRLLIISGENTLKRFTASIVYGNPDIGRAQFEVRTDFDVRAKEPGVSLDLSLPDQVLSGEKFDLKVNYRNLTQENFSDLELRLDYPLNFAWEAANPKPGEANNLWSIPNLAAGAGAEITITGRLIGPSQSFYNFGVRLTMNRRYTLNQKSGSLTIAPSPLESEISLNEQENYIVQLGDQLTYTINYKNNSGVGLADLVIKAKLTGEMFDFTNLKSKANFSSLTNTLTWNISNSPELKVLSVGDSGAVTFQIRVKDHFPIRRLGDKNYYLKVNTEIESPTVPYYLAAPKTTSLAVLENKVSGAIKIETKVYFRDAASGFTNRGPWPPKVNQPTQYTVHWLITNYATDVRNIEVRAFLESGVNWTGKIKSNTDSSPAYNERTQEIIWLINKIPATKGVISSPLETIFQIEATPNVTQAGSYQPLIKNTIITAFDEFSETPLQNQAAGVTTALPDDSTVQQIKGIVVQ